MSKQSAAATRLETARSVLGAGSAEAITRVLAIVLAIVTARTLEPHEVGLLGLAVIGTGLISMIGYYPETAAVAINDHSNHSTYSLAAVVVRGVAVAVLVGVVAAVLPLMSNSVMGSPEGKTQFSQLISILVWGPVLECLSGYPQVILQRRLDLRFLALAQVIHPVVFVGLATTLLLTGKGCRSVAAASVMGSASVFIIVWCRLWRRGWLRFEGWPSRRAWRETVVGSSRVFLGGFGSYLGSRLDNLLVAGVMGPTAMSYYSMAWNASRTPTGIISRAITFVLIPTFARMQRETQRMERGLKECLQFCYMALTPICALIIVSAPDLVTTILGTKWTPMVPALRLMSITVLVAPVLDASNALLVGTGRAQHSVVAAIARILVLIMLMPPLVHRWGLGGAAWVDLISAVASTVALLMVVRAALRNIRWPLASVLARPVVAAFCAGSLAWVVGSCIDAGFVRLGCQVAILSSFYPLIFAAVGGRASLVNLAALLRSALTGRVSIAESHS